MNTYKFKITFFLLLIINSAFSQVGIGNTDPKTSLDVTGALSLREGTALTLSNGVNNNIALGTTPSSFYRITGPTAAFSISSIAPVTTSDGQILTIQNTTTFPMTITHEGATGTAANRIYCANAADITLTGQYTTITLSYNLTQSRWSVISNSDSGTKNWSTTGNTGTLVTTNYIGTNDIQDFVVKTSAVVNTPVERMRITSVGNVGINATTPTATALLTINPNTNAIRSGIDMTLTGATSTATGLNIATANAAVNGITVTHSSPSISASLYGIGSVLDQTNIVSGYNGYRNGSGLSYGIYGINGTNTSYATNASTWAAFLQGRTVISSESSPTSAVGTDLEVRNTTTGAAAPATVSLRQTTSLATNGNVLANLNFGDNYVTTPQAQIKVIRDAAASSNADMPTAITFSTTPDGSSALTERMRISNAGNVGIGTTPSASTLLDMSGVTNKAMVAPNVALTATTTATITSPANGALIYNTATAGSGLTAVSPGYYYWNGSAWISMSSGGQSSTSYFSTGSLSVVTATTSFTLIPGMTATVTVPANCNVLVTADVGIITNSTSATNYSATDIALVVDGSTLTNGGYRRIYTVNNTTNVPVAQQAAISQSLNLSAGIHTIELNALGANKGGASATVGGDNTSALQGEMTITIIKR